jgi:splicing factor 3A subunit 3
MQAESDEAIVRMETKVDFSGEEVGGRYLDLHEHFHDFVNSKFKRDIPYSEFCVSFDDFADISRDHRLSKPYRSPPPPQQR